MTIKFPLRVEWLLLAALAFGIVFAGTWATGALRSNDPLASEECGSCHLAGKKVKAKNANLLTAPPEQLCLRCHAGALEASHPSGIVPSMEVPEIFPLDWKGNVTCSTCHFIHDPGHGQLRMEERGAPFCTACHDISFFQNMADQGGSVIVSGHMISGTDLELAQTDEYSVQCMACHDQRGEVPRVTLVGGIAQHASGATEHPVGVDYQQAYEYGGYRAVRDLPPSISLPGGQVSCISCHESYSGKHGAMVASNDGSNLCFQCHDL